VQREEKLLKMKQLLMLVLAVALTTMTPMLLVGGAVIKTDDADEDYAPLDLSHIDPVDLCLFICHSCFEQVRYHLDVSISGVFRKWTNPATFSQWLT